MIEIKGSDSAKQALDSISLQFPSLKCKGGKNISKLCCSSQCKNTSLHCENESCKQCYGNHKLCYKFEIKELINIVKGKIDLNKKLLIQLLQAQKQVLQKFAQLKKNMSEAIAFEWLQKKHLSILKDLYSQKALNLKGSEVLELCEALKRQDLKSGKSQKILKKFVDKSSRLVEEYQALKNEAMSALVSKTSNFQSQQTIFFKTIMDSKSTILDKKSDFDFLRLWLKNPSSLELIFRASQNDFDCKKFHEVCDNTEHTLIVAKTQFNKRIGGYTPLKWNSSVNAYTVDKNGESFIFSLQTKEKMKLTYSIQSIYCNNGYGPTFGGGHDLYLSNQCNKNNNSYCNFPHSYNNLEYINGQSSYTAFCGSPNDKKFKVLEYEVFRVIWE